MAYASRSGRARTSPNSPSAFGVCQRCSLWYNRCDLQNQVEWRGSALLPLYIFVCRECYDRPSEQLRAIVIPADPVPVRFPLTEPFLYDETDSMGLSTSTIDPETGIPVRTSTGITTVDGNPVGPAPFGRPVGLEQAAVMPLQTVNTNVEHFAVPVPVLSMIASGDIVSVTCPSAHGLSTDDQVSVLGASAPSANGFFSVTVTTATAFRYQLYAALAVGGSILTPGVRVVTTLIGLPLGYTTIPQVG